MESKAPSTCRLCNVSLSSPSAWREHAKSDWQYVLQPACVHQPNGSLTDDSSVYNLRVKVAEPGTVITPPSSSSPRRQKSKQTNSRSQSEDEVDDESDYESDDSNVEPPAGLKFNPGQCLFCNTTSDSFDDSLSHMTKSHGFTIPYQEHLTVDIETLAEYLHLVIHGYRECILCACRRRTVEGIQHHMTAKGHCRFDVVSDIAEFYDMPSKEYTADEESLRLPSGKLLNHPTKAAGPSASRTLRSSTRRRMALTTLPTSKPGSAGSDALAQDDETPLSSDTQLSRLAKGDQQSLAHLQDYQVRSLVASGAKAIEGSQREAKHSELKLSKAGNITLMGTFRADTSKRFRGPWG